MENGKSAGSKRTVVEEGTSFKGTLASSCPIDVRGRIEGEIETPSLTVSKSGAVHGRAKVGSVRSEGELSGEFDADSIELAGSVKDNTIIRARSFEVKLAMERGKMQVIFGQCELSVGDEPTEHDVVDVPAAAVEAAPEAPAAELSEAPPAEAPAPLAEAPALASEATAPEPAPPAEAPPAAAETAATEAASTEAAALDEVLAELGVPAGKAGSDEVAPKQGKKRRRKEDGEVAENSGWSQPPSQPPPAF